MMNEKNIAAVFKAFGDENRIRILQLLQTGENCTCRLLDELEISQPTLSHHMKILCDAHLVTGRREGKWTYYSISREGIEEARNCLDQLMIPESEEENRSCCSQ